MSLCHFVPTHNHSCGKAFEYRAKRCLVPKAGLEPALSCENRILNPTCLPISPLRQRGLG